MIKETFQMFDAAKRLLIDCGLKKSFFGKSSVNAQGNPVPWISLPAIEFLNSMKLENIKLFEFGSGNSTLYWAERMRQGHLCRYDAVECDYSYYVNMWRKDGFYRDHVKWLDTDKEYLTYAWSCATRHTGELDNLIPYDFVVVDGPIQLREKELSQALGVCHPEGIIMVDDANWISEHVEFVCERDSLFRVDFAGFGPGVSYTKVTSFLFRNPGWFLGNPVGGMAKYPGIL